uniref:Uncharacterized protein n=1 Tax=Octopus bimaculoides TaxID=37653 RepID=A0A0L8HIB9_OCTBM
MCTTSSVNKHIQKKFKEVLEKESLCHPSLKVPNCPSLKTYYKAFWNTPVIIRIQALYRHHFCFRSNDVFYQVPSTLSSMSFWFAINKEGLLIHNISSHLLWLVRFSRNVFLLNLLNINYIPI